MDKLNNALTWFEIPVNIMERAVNFYESAFEIKLQQFSFGNGLMMAMFPVEDGTVSGALTYHPDHYFPSRTGSLIYLNGNPDLQEILNRVNISSSGRVLQEKTLISEQWGYRATIEDSEGNKIALRSIN